MKYDPEIEVKVFLALKELGEASTKELVEYLKTQLKFDIEEKIVLRYLRRWKAKKVVSIVYHDKEVLWKLADIPPWYVSGIMALCNGTVDADMRTALDAMNEKLSKQGRIIEPRGVWGKYQKAQLIFETVDPILGGWVSKKDGETIIPMVNGKRRIPANWFKGWLGSNAALFDLPQSIRFHIQVSNAELPDFTPKRYQLKVKMGLNEYEAIPSGTEITVVWSFPLKGCKLKSLDEWRQFIEEICETPLRGLGANPFALGGRLKLLSLKII